MQNKKYFNYYIKITSFLLYILPILIISGPFLPDLVISISCFYFLIINFIRKDFKYFNNLFFKIFLIFYSYLVIRSFFTNYYSAIFYIRFGILPLIVLQLIDHNKDFEKFFFKTIFITLIVVSLDGLFQHFTGKNIIGLKEYTPDRTSGFFGDKGRLGSYIAHLCPFALIYLFIYLKVKHNYKNYLFILIFNLFLIVVVYSGERTSLFLILLSFFLLAIFKISYWRMYLSGFFIFCLLFFIIYQKETTVKNRIIINTKNQLGLSENYIPKKIFSETHQWHYTIAIRMFKDNLFFGQGINSFRDNCFKEKFRIDEKNSGCSTHPHNIYLQILAETGIFGFIFLFSAFIFLYIKIFKYIFSANSKKDNYLLQLFLLNLTVTINFFPFIPTGNFFNNWASILFFMPIGFFLKKLIK